MNDEKHYEFGANWAKYIDKFYSQDRLAAAQKALLDFIGLPTLKGKRLLDIGSGSGLHSLSAFNAKADTVTSFDYDPDSVSTTHRLRDMVGSPDNWTVMQGDVLNADFMRSLGTWDIVYSWGVLHHTGEMWKAIENAQACTAVGGLFLIALYSSDVATPSTQYWLDMKRRYNRAGALERRILEGWYIFRHSLDMRP